MAFEDFYGFRKRVEAELTLRARPGASERQRLDDQFRREIREAFERHADHRAADERPNVVPPGHRDI